MWTQNRTRTESGNWNPALTGTRLRIHNCSRTWNLEPKSGAEPYANLEPFTEPELFANLEPFLDPKLKSRAEPYANLDQELFADQERFSDPVPKSGAQQYPNSEPKLFADPLEPKLGTWSPRPVSSSNFGYGSSLKMYRTGELFHESVPTKI